MNFIELTELDGTKFIANINLILRVFVNSKGLTTIIDLNTTLNTTGYPIYVEESYAEVIEKIYTVDTNTLRLKYKNQ